MLIIKLTKVKCTKRLSKSQDRGMFTPFIRFVEQQSSNLFSWSDMMVEVASPD